LRDGSIDLMHLTDRLVSMLGPSGLLAPALVCVVSTACALGAGLFPNAPLRRQLLGGCTFTLAIITAGLEVAGRTGTFSRQWLLVSLAALTGGVAYSCRYRRLALPPPSSWPRAAGVEWSLLPLLAVSSLGVLAACAAAYWLPVWQWDALGYHLPFANFVLQDAGFAGLPPDVPYISTYPHNVELLFAALRSLLPDDRLVDIGQLPLGLVAAGAVAGIARELGARVPEAVAAGASFLALPAVFVQLPTNYVDVGVAAYFLLAGFFLLVPPTPMTLLGAGAALGLFLGTKPSAPPAAAMLAAVLLWRGTNARQLRIVALALLFAAVLGCEAYVTQWLRHGNPVWPAVLELGPLRFPGNTSVAELLAAGANAERVEGPLWGRILSSWTALGSRPAFDMRVGGFGPAALASMPVGFVVMARRRQILLPIIVATALLTPDPAVARYVLAFPGLLLSVAASSLSRSSLLVRRLGHGAAAIFACWSLRYAAPGLTGDGPPLFDYAAMTWSERRIAVGANGRPAELVGATDRLHAGDVAVFDGALSLPYLMWRSDLANRVLRVPDDASAREVRRLLTDPRARLVAAGQLRVTGRVVANESEWLRLFGTDERCEVYWRPSTQP